jgi:DNA excision repair protein ERCC-8
LFPVAHHGGVNALAIDSHMLLAGASSGSISLYNLNTSSPTRFLPRGSPDAHKFGITHLSFYPSDSGAFLSSSYDATLKLINTESFTPAASFELDAAIYSHDMSPNGSHYLVACGTRMAMVRLVDLRTSAAVHSLPGHSGAVLDVRWSPKKEHILATAGADGSIRLWDVRRSSPQLGVLDLEDSVGIQGRHRGNAHSAAVNGLAWTDDGRFLVSMGHDEKVRVWDMTAGSNTLLNFGPALRNRHLSRLRPCLVPMSMVNPGEEVLFVPNEADISMFELFQGTRLKRLRPPASKHSTVSRGSVKDLVWRPFDFEMYSAHSDGTIHAWKPEQPEDVEQDEETEEIIRKRQALDDIYNDVIKKRNISP